MKKYLVTLAIVVFTIAIIYVDVYLYYRNKAAENLIELVNSIEAERDSTHSLKNYEVLTDSLYNVLNEWHNGTSK